MVGEFSASTELLVLVLHDQWVFGGALSGTRHATRFKAAKSC